MKDPEIRPGYRRHEAEAIDDRQQPADGDTVYQELSRVEEVCDQYVQLRRESQEDVQSIESFAAQFPDIKSQILELLPTILMMEHARDRHDGKRKDGRVDSGPERLSQLDDFEIGPELGRGGMGIVHKARQISLDRDVALKILPRHTLTQKQIARFRREASTVAKLHHSNIAPVYAVGEQDGVHYFAMQLLHGASLEDMLESREFSSADVASIGRQVAQALQYAHEQGVFHRDIKPANLILDPNTTVWVTDFGLAATAELTSGSEDPKASGTLRYMPPEVLNKGTKGTEKAGTRKSDLDYAKADIYSLGITLIELLNGKPAFEATRVKDLKQAIVAGKLQPLSSGGKPISSDLEAVLRKSVSVDPADRYSTAGQFAEDLTSFENRMPVTARPVSAIGQGLRWAKRNPYLAFASSLAAISMIVTSFVMTISQLQIKDSLSAERRERVRAENASRLGSQSIDRIFNQFASDSMFLDQKVGLGAGFHDSAALPSPESAAMLKELSGFYDQLASEDLDSDLPIKAVMARRKVGEIQQRMGDLDAAVVSFEEALRVYTHLIETRRIAKTPKVVVELSGIRNQLGHALNVMGDFERSAAEHQISINELNVCLSEKGLPFDSEQMLRLELARSHYLLAFRTRPGMGPNSLPPHMSDDGQRDVPGAIDDKQLESLKRAITILESLEGVLDGRSELVRKYLLAISHREIAPDKLVELTAEDREHHARAVTLMEELADANEDVSVYKLELMKTLADINVFASGYQQPEIEAAYHSLSQAVELGAELAKSQPNDVGVLLESIHASAKLAKIAGLKSDFSSGGEKKELLQEKEQKTRSALSGQSFLSKQHPDSHAYRAWVAYFSLELAECSTMSNRPSTRRRLISRAINVLFQLPADFRKLPEVAALESRARRLSALLVGSNSDAEAEAQD